jgi:hypothetical protein
MQQNLKTCTVAAEASDFVSAIGFYQQCRSIINWLQRKPFSRTSRQTLREIDLVRHDLVAEEGGRGHGRGDSGCDGSGVLTSINPTLAHSPNSSPRSRDGIEELPQRWVTECITLHDCFPHLALIFASLLPLPAVRAISRLQKKNLNNG